MLLFFLNLSKLYIFYPYPPSYYNFYKYMFAKSIKHIRRKKVLESDAVVYNINKDYRIVRLRGNKCTLFFKNQQNKLLATLDGCNEIFTKISTADDNDLSAIEKGYLLTFIRAKKYSITKEVADYLQISIIKYLDGKEEYVSEKMLKKRINNGIDFAKVYVGKINAGTINIKDDSTNCSYDFSSSEISKLVIGNNCTVNIDLRDNAYIETIVIKEQFSGSINLSRSNVESIFIANNCRCNLTVNNSKKCFNLQIADIYSGNLNITNSCMYALSIGYYSYADIVLNDNIIKKDITIGDSFRGNLYAFNQNVGIMAIGDDCKGNIKTNNSSPSTGCKKIVIGNDFSGNINMNNDECIKTAEIGRKFCGQLEALYARFLQKIKFGKYYSGNSDFSSSNIESIYIDYGACGTLTLNNCTNLEMIEASAENKLIIDTDRKKSEIKINDNIVRYSFTSPEICHINIPIYKKIYQKIYNSFMQ